MKSHGMYGTRIYGIWAHIKSRCYNPSVERYKYYGGRGISMCEEWRNSFEAFYEWAMANGYKEGLSIDRIDNNGNYEPSNCRWVTTVDQMNNTTRNQSITYNGETHTIAEWARIANIPYKAFYARLKRGWGMEKALKAEYRANYNKITYKGETRTIAEWARVTGINYDTLKQRLNRYGWTVEEAFETK